MEPWIPWIFVVTGALFVVLGIPLALGKVPPNWFYGFRTPKTLSRSDIWYAANRAAGVDFTIAGVAMTVVSLAMALTCRDRPLLVVAVNLALMSAAMIVVTVRAFVHLRRL